MHVAILCVAYLPRLVKTGGPLYLAFTTPTHSGKIINPYSQLICTQEKYRYNCYGFSTLLLWDSSHKRITVSLPIYL